MLYDELQFPAIILDYYSELQPMRQYYSLCAWCASTSLYDDHSSGLIRGICRALNSNPPQSRIHGMLFLSDLGLLSAVICEPASRKAESQEHRCQESNLGWHWVPLCEAAIHTWMETEFGDRAAARVMFLSFALLWNKDHTSVVTQANIN